jgi:phosphate:Na+ symporter
MAAISVQRPWHNRKTIMSELQPVTMTIQLLGGLALFLYGMEKMTDGLKAATGKQMNVLLSKLTRNAVTGAITGTIVTAVIQSSSVTTVLVVGFVSAGLMTLVQSVGVIFGANVGTTFTAQIVAFNTTALALPLITIGFAMSFIWKNGVARHYGAMLMGLGLIFYGMAAMGSAMAPLRTHQGFIDLLQSMETPVFGMLAGALFTALVQSSSATIGLAVVMATQGLITLPAGIAIVFGAKIGTSITAILAAIGKPQDAKRAAAIHILFNVIGALIWLPFISVLANMAESVSPVYEYLEGTERMAAEVPRQIANAATIWAIANVLIFLPFSGMFARLSTRIIPERVVAAKALIEPKFLDNELISFPAMALERARLELGHMAELTESMLSRVEAAFVDTDLTELSKQNDQVVVLRDAVLEYLGHVGRGQMTDDEADEHARLVAATGNIESMGNEICRELAPMAAKLQDSGIVPSAETTAAFNQLLEAIRDASQSALQAIVHKDEGAAQTVIACRKEIWKLSSEYNRKQAARLAENDPDRLRKHRIQVDVLNRLNRLYSVAEHMAISVLPRSVLAGELA